MKTFVLTISKKFPVTHSKKGMPTDFYQKIISQEKKHTIRDNYLFWKHRIDLVNKGQAVISLREWSGKPYASTQTKLKTFCRGEIGIQKLTLDRLLGWFINDVDSNVRGVDLAKNDGLSWVEFKEWFVDVNDGDELAIIHFTDFRY